MPIPPKLLFIFIAIPVIEVFLFIKIGGAIGLWGTLGIIVITAMIGATLTRAQGVRALERFQSAALSGESPHREIFDGIMILIAGILLITPGFFTDACGFLLLAPPVRVGLRKRIAASFGKRFVTGSQPPSASKPSTRSRKEAPARKPRGKIIDAEIIDD